MPEPGKQAPSNGPLGTFGQLSIASGTPSASLSIREEVVVLAGAMVLDVVGFIVVVVVVSGIVVVVVSIIEVVEVVG